jgi:hypothetical protein
MKTELKSMTRLTDHQLTAQVIQLARHERMATASLVAHLAEFGVRKLYLGQGCASLFTFCTEILQLSEHETVLADHRPRGFHAGFPSFSTSCRADR